MLDSEGKVCEYDNHWVPKDEDRIPVTAENRAEYMRVRAESMQKIHELAEETKRRARIEKEKTIMA